MRISTLALLSCVLSVTVSLDADDWPQWGGPERDCEWREDGVVEKLPAKLSRRWTTPIGAGYAGPAVAGGRVFVTDRVLEKGAQNPENPFSRAPVRGRERVLCLDAGTGKVLWEHAYPCQYAISYPWGPRATPTVDGGRLYSVGAMGHFFCLEVADGKVVWSKDYSRDFGLEINTWGMSAGPLIDGDRVVLLVGGEDGACVVALDKRTGDEIWRAIDAKDPGYAPPVLIEAGGKRQLVVWNPDALHGLDPLTGEVYWKQPFEVQSGLSIVTPRHDPERALLFVTAFYNGPLMMRLDRDKPAASLLWKGTSDSEQKTDGLHAIMCTPHLDGGYIYGVCSYGQLRCLEAETGKRLWETRAATGSGRWWNAFLIRHRGRYWISNEQGELIIARLSPAGYEEVSRAFLIEPTQPVRRRKVVWSHPAFSNRRVYARNDKEIICVDLAADPATQGDG